jgi:ATP-dependent DNA helicase RecG
MPDNYPKCPTSTRYTRKIPTVTRNIRYSCPMDGVDGLIARLRHLGSDTPNIEVKSAHGGLPESLDETLCSFGNLPGGGLLILGLDEARSFAPVGLRDAASLAAGLVSKARQAIDPPLNVSVNVESFEGADLVVAEVHEVDASAKPCRVKRSGKAYLRFADGDYTLSQLEIDGFIANRTRPKFDEAEVPDASVEDLDRERLADFLVTARSLDRRLAPIENDTDLLLKTGVISRSNVPTVAGLLALGAYPQQFLRYFTMRAALLPADARQSTRALDSATFTGPIGAMLEDAVGWVHKNSRVQVRVDTSTGHVRDQADPPVVAVRELISNALVHRDLAEWATSRSIELRMSPLEFRLTNPGGLFGIAVDRLGIHPLTSARNRLLIDVCKFVRTADGKVVEALATGIPSVFESLGEAGMPPPEFFDQGLSFTAIVRRTSAPATAAAAATHKLPTAAEQAALAILTSPTSAAALGQKLGITTAAAHKRLRTLRDKGLVEVASGSGRPLTFVRRASR